MTEPESSSSTELATTTGAELAEQAGTALLAALDLASDVHAAEQRPANTNRSYRDGWAVWEQYCAATGLPVTSATRGTLRGFVHWLWTERRAAPATVDSRLSAVTVTLRREYQVTISPDDTAAARQLLKDYRRKAAEQHEPERGRGQASPLLLPDLRKICAACPDSITGIRDRALLLIAFSIAGRRSEVAGLMARDITADPNGLLVDIRVSKTEPRQVAIPYGSNPLTCPVRAWQAWQSAAELAEDGPAFRRIDRHGNLLAGLSGAAVGEIVTKAGERAGVPIHLTGHSARAGLATEARRAGKDAKAISATTGHRPNSAVLAGYMRTVDRWDGQDNALIGIGL